MQNLLRREVQPGGSISTWGDVFAHDSVPFDDNAIDGAPGATEAALTRHIHHRLIGPRPTPTSYGQPETAGGRRQQLEAIREGFVDAQHGPQPQQVPGGEALLPALRLLTGAQFHGSSDPPGR